MVRGRTIVQRHSDRILEDDDEGLVILGHEIADAGNLDERAGLPWSKRVPSSVWPYPSMLDREGVAGPVDLMVIGDEETCANQIEGVPPSRGEC